jgi:hypothetical protein
MSPTGAADRGRHDPRWWCPRRFSRFKGDGDLSLQGARVLVPSDARLRFASDWPTTPVRSPSLPAKGSDDRGALRRSSTTRPISDSAAEEAPSTKRAANSWPTDDHGSQQRGRPPTTPRLERRGGRSLQCSLSRSPDAAGWRSLRISPCARARRSGLPRRLRDGNTGRWGAPGRSARVIPPAEMISAPWDYTGTKPRRSTTGILARSTTTASRSFLTAPRSLSWRPSGRFRRQPEST